MKRSGQVGLVLLTALGLASCSRSKPQPQQPVVVVNPPSGPVAAPLSEATMTWDNKPRDPCAQQYFDETLCKTAVQNRGYHYGGTWIPMIYSHPYSSYYSGHSSYISSGGAYVSTPVEVYHSGFKAPAVGEVVRGGFGSTASAMRAHPNSSSSSSQSTGGAHSTSTPSSPSGESHSASTPSSPSSGAHGEASSSGGSHASSSAGS